MNSMDEMPSSAAALSISSRSDGSILTVVWKVLRLGFMGQTVQVFFIHAGSFSAMPDGSMARIRQDSQ